MVAAGKLQSFVEGILLKLLRNKKYVAQCHPGESRGGSPFLGGRLPDSVCDTICSMRCLTREAAIARHRAQ
jgi:hypothetical protein